MFEILLHLACKTVYNRQKKQNTDMENNKGNIFIL